MAQENPWFIDQISALAGTTQVVTVLDILTVLAVSTVLSFVAAKVYQNTHEGISYSQSFVHTLVIFGILVSMIMLIIGSNIARAFTLVGALSIVRFRNAIKETRDVGFVFFLMAIGMAAGTRFYVLAIFMTLFVCAVIILMQKTNFGYVKKEDFILKVTSPNNIDIENKIRPVLQKHVNHFELLNIETTDDVKLSEYVFLIRFDKSGKDASKLLIKKVKELNKGHDVSLLGTSHLVY